VRWADHSYRGVLPVLCVRSRNLSSGAAWAPLGLLRHGTYKTERCPRRSTQDECLVNSAQERCTYVSNVWVIGSKVRGQVGPKGCVIFVVTVDRSETLLAEQKIQRF
jgi:hypothetical protein